MAVIKSVRSKFDFIVSEANDWRSRDQVIVDGGADGILTGTLLVAGASDTDPAVAWAAGGTPIGILCQSVAAGEQEKRTVLARDAEVVGADLELPDAVDLKAVATALKPLGIIVRVNDGIYIDVVDPA